MIIISVAGGKGGTGKTFDSVNLACALSTEGGKLKGKSENVLIIDFDPADRVYGHFFLNKPENKYTIYDFLESDISLDKIITKTDYPGIDIIMSDPRLVTLETSISLNENYKILFDHFALHINELNKYKYVVIDNHPSIGPLTKVSLLASDYVLIPTQLEKDSIETLYIIIDEINKCIKETSENKRNADLKIAGILPSMVQLYRSNQEYWQSQLLKVEEYKKLLLPLNIALSEAAKHASTCSIPFYFYKPKHKISMAFNRLTEVFK